MNKIKLPNQRMLNRTIALVSKSVAKKTLKHFQKNFAKGGFENPSGQFERWAKRKHKHNHPLLKKTKKLQKSFKTNFKRNGFEIENVAPYAGYVQEGTENNPERPILYRSKELDNIVIQELNKGVLKMLGLK